MMEQAGLANLDMCMCESIREEVHKMGVVGWKTLIRMKRMWGSVDKAMYEHLHRKWTRKLIALDSRYSKIWDTAHMSLAEIKATVKYHPTNGMDAVVAQCTKKRKLRR